MGFLNGISDKNFWDNLTQIVSIGGIVTVCWKAIDRFFEYMAKKDLSQIERAVDERLEIKLKPLQESINTMMKVLIERK